MSAATQGQVSIGWIRLLSGQFRQCGFLYALRKLLAITLLHKLSAHLAVTHSLSLPRTGELMKHHPKGAFKYLHRYLARSFNIHSRSIIIANHYRYLNDLVRPDFISRVCRGKIVLWEDEADGHKYEISLTYLDNKEGELTLDFCENEAPLFTLSFTIAPGAALKLPDKQVMLVGRLQGTLGKKDSIRRATGSFHDLIPASLLLDAARTIAASLNIHGIVGVNARNQVCLNNSRSSAATCVYDEFWVSAGASSTGDLGYYLPTIQDEKPLSSIKNNHRSRVKRKRQFRGELMKQISLAFDRQCIVSGKHQPTITNFETRFEDYCGTLAAMNDLSFATSASITSQR